MSCCGRSSGGRWPLTSEPVCGCQGATSGRLDNRITGYDRLQPNRLPLASPLVEGEGGDCFHDYVRQAAVSIGAADVDRLVDDEDDDDRRLWTIVI
jgi:hypothetical protein